jgi:hypothetical protein
VGVGTLSGYRSAIKNYYKDERVPIPSGYGDNLKKNSLDTSDVLLGGSKMEEQSKVARNHWGFLSSNASARLVCCCLMGDLHIYIISLVGI